jgi:hypothetical protein
MSQEQLLVETFRNMSDRCQVDMLNAMIAMAKAFPREQRLRLVCTNLSPSSYSHAASER